LVAMAEAVRIAMMAVLCVVFSFRSNTRSLDG